MMIRSCRIPPLLSRICGDGIHTAMVATTDGELLGSAQSGEEGSNRMSADDISDVGALVTEIAADYMRLGNNEMLLLDQRPNNNNNSTKQQNQMQCLIMELDQGLVAVSSAGLDCIVICLAEKSVPHGMLKARLTALASHVQEALSPLTEPIP